MRPAHGATIFDWLRSLALTAALLAAFAASAPAPAVAEESPAYILDVGDVTAAVGEQAVMRATLKIRDGYRILKAYNNRVIKLSSFDDGVAFAHDMVAADLVDGALIFNIGLQATKPGKHPINGLFRVGYIVGTDEMDMVSLRLIANVIGTGQ